MQSSVQRFKCRSETDTFKNNKIKKLKDKCSILSFRHFVLSMLPIVNTVKNYRVNDYLRSDVISGVSVACLHFPHALALGILASVSPANGLYTVFFPGLAYIIFGTSQHVSMGTNAVLCIFTAELVNIKSSGFVSEYSTGLNHSSNISSLTLQIIGSKIKNDVMAYKISVAAGSSFIVGITLIFMGFFRLGFITSYLSSSFISGFTTAGGIHIIAVQIPSMLGIHSETVNRPGKLIYKIIDIFKKCPETHFPTLLLSLVCLVILIFIKDFINERFKDKLRIPIPIDVVLVVGVTIVSYYAKFEKDLNIDIVGEIPNGLPTPTFPTISVDMVGNSALVAIMCFILTVSLTRLCEIKHGYTVDDNNELIAYGAANLFGSFFSCFPSAVAPPRTLILSTMGSKTTLNGLVASLVVFCIIMFLGKYLTWVPNALLAVMIIAVVKNLLVQLKELPRLWKINRYDFVIFIGTLLAGILIDFPYGMYVGVFLSFLVVIIQSQNSVSFANTVGKYCIETSSIANDIAYDEIPNESEIIIFRMESSLYFATADNFKKKLYKQTMNPRSKEIKLEQDWDINVTNDKGKMSNQDDEITSCDNTEMSTLDKNINVGIKYVVIDCSSINYIDMDGARALSDINVEFCQIGVTVILASCTKFMANFINDSDLSKQFGDTKVFDNLPNAYDALSKRNSPSIY